MKNTRRFLVAAGLLLICGAAAAYLRTAGRTAAPPTALATRQPYERVVVVQGELESANNVEVRCEVRINEVRAEDARENEARFREILDSASLRADVATAATGTGAAASASGTTTGGLGATMSSARLGAGTFGTNAATSGNPSNTLPGGTRNRTTGGTATSAVRPTTATSSTRGASSSALSSSATTRSGNARGKSNRSGGGGAVSGGTSSGSGGSGSGGASSGTATGRPSTAIIDIIAEGTQVQKGDWLITFDSSQLEQSLSKQKIAVNTIEATMIEAQAYHRTAVIALKEYLKGTYNEQRKAFENQLFVAEDILKKSQLAYDSIDRLVSRELLTPLQLEGERARVQAAKNDVELARQQLASLDGFTKSKMVVQLEGDIRAAEVTYRNAKASYEEEVKRLKDIEDQISKCAVTAPQAGQVVYANVQSRRASNEFVVEAGAPVRERQVILHLPDLTQIQVKTTVAESQVSQLREGMPAEINIDAFRDLKLTGTVTRVNLYAEPGSYWSSSTKEYETLISINDPPPNIRVGLTAEVRMLVEQREEALTLPVQAVFEEQKKTFCIVQEDSGFALREVIVDSTDGEVVALNEAGSQLRAGDKAVLNPRRYLHLVESGEPS